MAYSVDTNANSGASGANTFGSHTYGGSQSTGVPPWAIVAIAAVVALVLMKRKKGG